MGWIRRTAVLGVGYLLGARAGRERYDQILDTARRSRPDPSWRRTWHRLSGC